jgi:hypothetical protein
LFAFVVTFREKRPCGSRKNQFFGVFCSVANPGLLSRIRVFSIPDPGSEFCPSRIPDLYQRI